MEYRRLGRTGLQVSELCLGTMQFRWTADEAAAYQVLDAFVQAGGTFVDTADIYSGWVPGLQGGEAEALLGEWFERRANRPAIVLATKVRGRMWPGPNGEGLSRAHLVRACEDSLRRLRTDYIDLYQPHWPDEGTPVEETLRALDDLVRAGKVRYLGCSNHRGWQVVEAVLLARQAGLAEYVAIQPHWSLVHRAEFEGDAYAVARKYGLGVLPYSPLGAGFLSGKYRRGQPAPASLRAGRVERYLTERNFNLLDKLDEIAHAHGQTVSAVALAWLLSREQVTAPIIGANTPAQLAASLGAAGLQLEPVELSALDALSAWQPSEGSA